MKENLILANYKVESEAYQALSELKRDTANANYTISQAVIVKKENDKLTIMDGFVNGLASGDDTWTGSLIGSLVGVLGGPLGVLLGGSMGMLDFRCDLGCVKSGDRHFKVIEFCGQCGLIVFLRQQNDCCFAVKNTVTGLFKQRSIVRHIVCIHCAADQHTHAAAEKDSERSAENTYQAADQAALPCVIAVRQPIGKAIHDGELIVFFLYDHGL